MKKDYETLEITKDASDELLKKAYRDLMKKYHPDAWENKSIEEKQMAKAKAQQISEAYKNIKKEREKSQGLNHSTTNHNTSNYQAYKESDAYRTYKDHATFRDAFNQHSQKKEETHFDNFDYSEISKGVATYVQNFFRNSDDQYIKAKNKLEKTKETLEQKKEKISKEEHEIFIEILDIESKLSKPLHKSLSLLNERIRDIHSNFSNLISQINSSLINKLNDKRRIKKQQEILDRETEILEPLEKIQKCISEFINHNNYQNVLQINLNLIDTSLYEKEGFYDIQILIEYISEYKILYEENSKKLETQQKEKQKKEAEEKQIQELLNKVEEQLNNLRNQHYNTQQKDLFDYIFDESPNNSRK